MYEIMEVFNQEYSVRLAVGSSYLVLQAEGAYQTSGRDHPGVDRFLFFWRVAKSRARGLPLVSQSGLLHGTDLSGVPRSCFLRN